MVGSTFSQIVEVIIGKYTLTSQEGHLPKKGHFWPRFLGDPMWEVRVYHWISPTWMGRSRREAGEGKERRRSRSEQWGLSVSRTMRQKRGIGEMGRWNVECPWTFGLKTFYLTNYFFERFPGSTYGWIRTFACGNRLPFDAKKDLQEKISISYCHQRSWDGWSKILRIKDKATCESFTFMSTTWCQ